MPDSARGALYILPRSVFSYIAIACDDPDNTEIGGRFFLTSDAVRIEDYQED
jgi:hypothetical protein